MVTGSSEFEVVFSSGERQTASLVAADADADLAVIRVAALPEGIEPLPLAAADNLEVGQTIQITVLRNGRESLIPLVLGARP